MRIVSVVNLKGGVGKTTFTGCIAQALALTGFRVLVIDNDSQHNLSTMLGAGVHHPGIRDVYRSGPAEAPQRLLESIRTTFLDGLHIVTSDPLLSPTDVHEPRILKAALERCAMSRFYDYLLIDNAPGFDVLQQSSLLASDELFVPTELRQFAVDGVFELDQILKIRFPDAPRITRIVPNLYRESKRQNGFAAALRERFADRVTETMIPWDMVFDEMVTNGKVLFLNRLYSRGAAYYLKLVHELFNFTEDELWEKVLEKRREQRSNDARARFFQRKASMQQGSST